MLWVYSKKKFLGLLCLVVLSLLLLIHSLCFMDIGFKDLTMEFIDDHDFDMSCEEVMSHVSVAYRFLLDEMGICSVSGYRISGLGIWRPNKAALKKFSEDYDEEV